MADHVATAQKPLCSVCYQLTPLIGVECRGAASPEVCFFCFSFLVFFLCLFFETVTFAIKIDQDSYLLAPNVLFYEHEGATRGYDGLASDQTSKD